MQVSLQAPLCFPIGPAEKAPLTNVNEKEQQGPCSCAAHAALKRAELGSFGMIKDFGLESCAATEGSQEPWLVEQPGPEHKNRHGNKTSRRSVPVAAASVGAAAVRG